MKRRLSCCYLAAGMISVVMAAPVSRLSGAEYERRVLGAWLGQIAGAILGWPFEGKVASTVPVIEFSQPYTYAPVDDDYYYEIVALRAFEKYGPDLSVEQLGEQWKQDQAGSWGSSEQARLALERGIHAPDTGHPRYNRWFHTIGPQFSADIYGMLSPGRINLAGELGRRYGHVNGYAEGADGAVFIAGMVSEAFFEPDPRQVVRRAARLIHPQSNYRRALDQMIGLAEAGVPWKRIARELEDTWRPEYPALNNAIPNGVLVALGLWFGEGDYMKTINLIVAAADFSDADCNAANAGAVIGAMRGSRAIPAQLVGPLHDRIFGEKMGPVTFRRPVDEKISDIAARTARMGRRILERYGSSLPADAIEVRREEPAAQPLEKFSVDDYGSLWNPDWKLERAGRGGIGGGRGATYLDGTTLVTYPRDESRRCFLWRRVEVGAGQHLQLEVAAAEGRAWKLSVFADNQRLLERLIEGRSLQVVQFGLEEFAGKSITLRLYQDTLVPDRLPSSARWLKAEVKRAP